jgi:hypothetical protein
MRGIDVVRFDLGLGDDAGLEGISQNDVFVGEVWFEDFEEPRPMRAAIWRL